MSKQNMAGALERRRPRKAYTAVLVRLCKRLDRQSQFEFEAKGGLIDWRRKGTYAVKKLWVVGSYARGAASCGDLDLVVKIERIEGDETASLRRVSKAAFGSPPDVRIYPGEPNENESGAVFIEAVEIWSPNTDWRAAIGSIKEDAAATRFARDYDLIPLRREQLLHALERTEWIVELHKKRILEWSFFDLEDLPKLGKPTKVEQRAIEIDASVSSKKTSELTPFLIRYLRRRRLGLASFYGDVGASSKALGVSCYSGPSWVKVEKLNHLTYSRLAVIPHLSRRGPNGVWEIRRGPNHPLEVAFQDVRAYLVVGSDGRYECDHMDEDDNGYAAVMLEVFGSEEEAIAFLEEEQEAEMYADDCTVTCVSGSELLDALGHADVLKIDGKWIGVSRLGRSAIASMLSEECEDSTDSQVTARIFQALTNRALNLQIEEGPTEGLTLDQPESQSEPTSGVSETDA